MTTKELVSKAISILENGETVLVYGIGTRGIKYRTFEYGVAVTDIRKYIQWLSKYQQHFKLVDDVTVTSVKSGYVLVEDQGGFASNYIPGIGV